jgi:ABC-type Fe3+-siderophore transport system permease subunit
MGATREKILNVVASVFTMLFIFLIGGVIFENPLTFFIIGIVVSTIFGTIYSYYLFTSDFGNKMQHDQKPKNLVKAKFGSFSKDKCENPPCDDD